MTPGLGVDLGWIDIAMGGFLLLSVLIGLLRGVVFELLSLAGWFVAWVAAMWATPMLAPHLPVGTPGSALNHGVAFACVFLVVLIVWGLAARFVRALIRATPLSGIDRLLGAVFGLVRGLLVLLVVATLVDHSPWATDPAWQASRGSAWLGTLLNQVRPYFSDDNQPHTDA